MLDAFAAKIAAEPEPIEAARFKALIKEVQKESGVKGPALFHPIRILLTGVQSGPEFDKLVPLMEEGARLGAAAAGPQRQAAGGSLDADDEALGLSRLGTPPSR